MSMYGSRIPIAVLVGVLIALAGKDVAFADSPNVTAVLSNAEAVVGEMVQLQIKVSGAGDTKRPENISVDGWAIHNPASDNSREQQFTAYTGAQAKRCRFAGSVGPFKSKCAAGKCGQAC